MDMNNFSPFSFEDAQQLVNRELLESIMQDIANASEEDNKKLRKAAKTFIRNMKKIQKEFRDLIVKAEISYQSYQQTQRMRKVRGRDIQQYFFLTKLSGQQFHDLRNAVRENQYIYSQIIKEAEKFRQVIFESLGRKLQVMVVTDEGDIISYEPGADIWHPEFSSSGYYSGRLSAISPEKGQNILRNLEKYGNALGETQQEQEKNFQELRLVYRQIMHRRTTYGAKSKRVMWLTKGLENKKWGVAYAPQKGSLREAYAAAVFNKQNKKIINEIDLQKKLHLFFSLFGWQPDNTPGTFIEDINFQDGNGVQYSASIKSIRAEFMGLGQLILVGEEIAGQKTFSNKQLALLRQDLNTKVSPSIKLSVTNSLKKSEQAVYNQVKKALS